MGAIDEESVSLTKDDSRFDSVDARFSGLSAQVAAVKYDSALSG